MIEHEISSSLLCLCGGKRSCEIPLSTTLLMTLSQCNAELISADKEHHVTIKVVKYSTLTLGFIAVHSLKGCTGLILYQTHWVLDHVQFPFETYLASSHWS